MKLLGFVLVSFLLITEQRGSACGDSKPSGEVVNAEEVWNHAGWEIPGLKGSHSPKPAQPATSFAYGATVTELRPGKNRTFRRITYEMHPGSEKLELRPSEDFQYITNIQRYDVGSRPFLYVVSTETTPQDLTKVKHGEPTAGFSACGSTNFYYYDETGSGKFERQVVRFLNVGGVLSPASSSNEVIQRELRKFQDRYLHVPGWAKQLADKNPKPSQSSSLEPPRP